MDLVEVDLPARLDASGDRGTASAPDALPDAIPAAAWLLVTGRLAGAREVTLREGRRDGATLLVRSSLHPILEGEPARAWVTGVDGRRRAAPWTPAGPGAVGDALWVVAPLDGSDVEGVLQVGVEGVDPQRLRATVAGGGLDAPALDAILASVYRAALAMAETPEEPVSQVDILGAEQRRRLLAGANLGPRPRDVRVGIGERFSRRAAERREEIALAWSGGTMSYAELDRRSSAVARRLLSAGVQEGSVVGLALERSPEAVVALLGILKAGSAYLPLDVRHPAERVAFMLEDAGATWLVERSGATPVSVTRARRFDAGVLCAPPGPGEDTPVTGRAGAEAIAYVMYTSGSTGQPKGIEIPHRGVLRLVEEVDYVHLGPDVAVLHAAPLGFDASTFEIWGPLLNGGRCVLHDEAVPTGPGLARSIERHGVTTAWLTAALFNAVVDDEPRNLAGLRELLVGGEALSVSHVRRAQAALPGLALVNGYGPTECTTFSTTFRIPRDLDPATRSIPIGTPIPDTTAYVVGPELQLLPVGVPGELCIGGAGLARGYLRRPELTAERFVQSPFGAAGERIYRTGDVVRLRPDGVIEFLGRRDGQVKIRGFRVEVGEVEAALGKHPGVLACAVVARDDLPGGTRLVAYVVPAPGSVPASGLRSFLSGLLPEFMVPATFVELPVLPRTENGKLDRKALPRPDLRRPDLGHPYVPPGTPTEAALCRVFADLLGLDRVGRLDNFFELGGTSLLVIQAVARLQREGHRQVSATTFFSDPTPAAIASSLDGGEARASRRSRRGPARKGSDLSEPVAIIGMAGRFPGAGSVEELWRNLQEGRESIRFFRADELDPSIPASLRDDPAYVRARGVVEGVELFDAAFFGIPPREAELMDPQQRIFMEIAWECMERAGYPPDGCGGPVGVFAGMYNATYFQRHVTGYPERIARVGEFQVMLGNEKDYVATRTANRLGLTGPAVSVHTACSTSLVAVAQAVSSLRAGQCDMALAGGASITCPPSSGYLYQEGAMLSPDGHTRTFDARAQGTVFSDGAAVVLLKRLSDAIADGDAIAAVIRGVAVNNDGGAKASFTAPSVDGQAAVIAAALADAGVNAREVGYVETHGTATPLGDPVEVEALTRAFREHTPDTGFCRIGSAKTNVGHLVIAAGATGLIKAALSLAREEIPASLHFSAPNPKLELQRTPFVVNDRRTPWPRGTVPRRAGVSSFGVGGTNAHVVLEEAPPSPPPAPRVPGPELLVLSARTPEALARSAERLAAHLEATPGLSLRDVAHTLAVGRTPFAERCCVVADSTSAAASALRDASSPWRATGTVSGNPGGIALLFPGQAAQYAAMGSRLHAADPVFRAAFDECLDALRGTLDFDLEARLFSGDEEALRATETTQPALFCVEYALARHWLGLGLRPRALLGHSVGEFVAAAVAGVMRVEDAARLVARRGRLMQALPAGSMLAVRAPAFRIEPRLRPGVSMAAENAPGLCVVAGATEAVEALQRDLEQDGLKTRLLQTSHAFHSAMMDPVVAPFEAEVRRIPLSAPTIPIFSTVAAAPLTPAQACDPGYWARHLREPVRFSPALETLLREVPATLLEVGPRTTLTTLARQHAGPGRPAPVAVASLGDVAASEVESLRLALGRLWTLGAVDRPDAGLDASTRRRVELPTYPFERKRHWVDAVVPSAGPVSRAAPGAPEPSPPSAQSLPESIMIPSPSSPSGAPPRSARLLVELRSLLEEVSGLDLAGADSATPLVELGLDSLSLTQVAIQLKQTFKVNVTFRQLMEQHRSLGALAAHLDRELPAEAPPAAPAAPGPASPVASAAPAVPASLRAPPSVPAAGAPTSLVEQVIRQQMELMAQQLALLGAVGTAGPVPAALSPVATLAPAATIPAATAPVQTPPAPPLLKPDAPAEAEGAGGLQKYDVKKAFGAIARIHTDAAELTERQRARLDAFLQRYVARTARSKAYTAEHRPHLADPRVVNGFRPLLKEIVYQVLIERSKGAHVWDLDGNRYVDVLNGFGMNLFGWQPAFVDAAVRRQLDAGHEIGPQHPLAGEVARLVCEMTGFDRAGFCNTGSEAVMGAMRVARTVTGRSTIALFSGSYHGIFDEVIVRAGRNYRAYPAAPGILPSTAQNVLVLDYGTPESMEVLRARAGELAAVLVEPVQSRRPDLQPRAFLKELRQVTADAGALLILDEVVTGFRCHPGGIQALFDLRADLCTYGKVVGGGFPIGIIAGKREFMDALDGGAWQYGDASIPTVGVTYFAGTFVRHPLALAAARAVLERLRAEGPALQEELTRRTGSMVGEMNSFCREVGAPVELRTFASLWRISFTEDHPLQDLLFAMMRSRGIHILDNFPCFMTTAHAPEDVAEIQRAFRESVLEMQEAGFLPRRGAAAAGGTTLDAARPPVPGARLGKDRDGRPAWFVPHPTQTGKFVKVDS